MNKLPYTHRATQNKKPLKSLKICQYKTNKNLEKRSVLCFPARTVIPRKDKIQEEKRQHTKFVKSYYLAKIENPNILYQDNYVSSWFNYLKFVEHIVTLD